MSSPATAPLLILAAGEASGDRLGAGLIQTLRQQRPELQFAGIGGNAMAAAGMDCWYHIDELSVMGLAEVLRHLPRLLKLRRQFHHRILQQRPLAFIGIDAPDFNLPLAARLKRTGLTTFHYVSPSVWAWRPGRVQHIAAACDCLLCLFPFEPKHYDATHLDCVVTGHPRADEIPLEDQRETIRQRLGIASNRRVVALLPGSRRSERQRLAPIFLQTAQHLRDRNPEIDWLFISTQPDAKGAAHLRALHAETAPEVPLRLLDHIDEVLSACDTVLAASGTVTLEAMLYHRPQVAAYRLNTLTYHWVKTFRLMRSPWLTLPNILAGEALIPEIFQHEAEPERLAAAIEAWWQQARHLAYYQERALTIHRQLRLGAHRRAAQAILERL